MSCDLPFLFITRLDALTIRGHINLVNYLTIHRSQAFTYLQRASDQCANGYDSHGELVKFSQQITFGKKVEAFLPEPFSISELI